MIYVNLETLGKIHTQVLAYIMAKPASYPLGEKETLDIGQPPNSHNVTIIFGDHRDYHMWCVELENFEVLHE